MSIREHSQRDAIRSALLAGESLTPLDALDRFRCFRLGGRIHELRAEGLDIVTDFVTSNGKTFASYRLSPPQEGQGELWGQQSS